MADIENGLKRDIVKDQIELIRLRNTSPAFNGEMKIIDTEPQLLHIRWHHPDATVTLRANLDTHGFTILCDDGDGEKVLMSF
jgi:sucrose phosphorylase